MRTFWHSQGSQQYSLQVLCCPVHALPSLSFRLWRSNSDKGVGGFSEWCGQGKEGHYISVTLTAVISKQSFGEFTLQQTLNLARCSTVLDFCCFRRNKSIQKSNTEALTILQCSYVLLLQKSLYQWDGTSFLWAPVFHPKSLPHTGHHASLQYSTDI